MVRMVVVFDARHGGPKETVELRITNREADRLMDARKKAGVDNHVMIGIELFNEEKPKSRRNRR